MTRSARVSIHWLVEIPAGGLSLPDGRITHPAKFDHKADEWGRSAWSLIVTPEGNPDAEGNQKAVARFMVPDAPHEWLDIGRTFTLYAGWRGLLEGVVEEVMLDPIDPNAPPPSEPGEPGALARRVAERRRGMRSGTKTVTWIVVVALLVAAWVWSTHYRPLMSGGALSYLGKDTSAIPAHLIYRRIQPPIPFAELESKYSMKLLNQSKISEIIFVPYTTWTLPRGRFRVLSIDANGIVIGDTIGSH